MFYNYSWFADLMFPTAESYRLSSSIYLCPERPSAFALEIEHQQQQVPDIYTTNSIYINIKYVFF